MQLEVWLQTIKGLPSLSGALSSALNLLGQDDVELGDIAAQLSLDQAAVARLLRVANSSFYGISGQVATVEHAMSVIGFANTKRLVLALSVMSRFPQPQIDGMQMSEFWKHSLETAVIAEIIATNRQLASDQFFTAGILHDIGRLVLCLYRTAEYSELLAAVSDRSPPLHVLERERFEFDHAEVGSAIASQWNFPNEICSVLRWHHEPGGHGDSESILYVANQLSHILMGQTPSHLPEDDSVRAILSELHASDVDLEGLKRNVVRQVNALAAVV